MSAKIRQARFHVEMHDAMERINDATHFDKRLYAEDIEASQAHCRMLVARNIISRQDGESIIKGLTQIREEIDKGDFTFDSKLEDVHMNIEHRLHELIGDAAGRLHTARSRNDQVATDFRLYIRRGIETIEMQLKELQNALVDAGEQHAATIMPGFTHLQPAQPVTFGHHLLAYVEMFERDRIRFANARENLNESPLGACALAGTSFPIDPEQTAADLGFRKPCGNSIDAVSDRDFALESLAAASISAMHLSRLAEEIVLWSSALVGFVRLSDAYSTGSSIMPQKRNPDAAELVRAKAGRIAGDFVSLLMVMKALPLSYSKDMQEDKEPLFDALESLGLGIAAMRGMVGDMTPDPEAMRAASAAGFSTATDLADWLVREHALPFREAHRIVGELVGIAEARGTGLEELSLQEFQKVDARIDESALRILSVEDSVASRTSPGGTSPGNVAAAIARWRKHLRA
ncbi:MAG: argininosuccinate lyase [Hyphomicrobiales bacterium]|nr:argininosuccinate lyase [Hyphomicrobiales bacterium]MCY4049557.1 argininosuccinate lyase [Hyphomicrobiales bacterium]